MAERASLVILAGGASRRMGRPKHLLPTSRGTVVDHIVAELAPLFHETLFVGKDPAHLPNDVRFVKDVLPEQSPLVGIYSSLLAIQTERALVMGCDMPFVVPKVTSILLAASEGVDIAVPRVGGYYEPLLAVYGTSCVPVIRAALAEGCFRITAAYSSLRVREVSESALRAADPELVSFTNLNTPKHLALLAHI